MNASRLLICTLLVLAACLAGRAALGVRESAPDNEHRPENTMSGMPNIVTPYDRMDIGSLPAVIEMTDAQRAYVIDVFGAARSVVEGGTALETEENRILGQGRLFLPKLPAKPVTDKFFDKDFRMNGMRLRFTRKDENAPWTMAALAVHTRNFPRGAYAMRLPRETFGDFVLDKVIQESRPDERIKHPIVFYFLHKKVQGMALKIEVREDLARIDDAYPSSFHLIEMTRANE